MATNKKQELNWLFNYPDAKKAVVLLGVQNLTEISSITIDKRGNECIDEIYNSMPKFGTKEAKQRVIEFIKRTTRMNKSENYMYYRFKRNN